MTRLALADQASRSVLLTDEARTATPWAWTADTDPACAGFDLPRCWNSVSEAKGRTRGGRRYLLTTASGGLAAMVRVTTGRAEWAVHTGDHNLHSIELLPDGSLVVAASTQNLVRRYRGPEPAAEHDLKGAHGLQWDPHRRLLWALGTEQLAVLDPDTLRVRESHPLPTAGGHDLAPVRGDRDRLWVTTREEVLQFSVRRREFTDYPDRGRISRPEVKAVGDDPADGTVLTVTPEPGHEVSWCTTGVDLHHAAGRSGADRYTLPGSGLYKARWWVPRYW